MSDADRPHRRYRPRDRRGRGGTRDLAEAMNATSTTLPADEDEFERAGLAKAGSMRVDAPRVAAARVAFESSTPLRRDRDSSSTVPFAEVVHAHVDDELLVDGKLHVIHLDAVGRLSGSYYASTDDRISIARPP